MFWASSGPLRAQLGRYLQPVQTTPRDGLMTRLLALIWPDLRNADADEATGAARFEVMLDRLDDLSPRIEAVGRGVALLEITGLEPLLGDERRIAARAVALARGVAPLPVRAGVGDNRWLAVLAARLARPQRPGAPAAFHAIPAREAATALAPLSLDLLPADAATRVRFALLGLTVMGELATLPRSAVGAQFGAAGERLQQLARGEDPRPLIPRRRPERLNAHAAFEPPAEGIAGIALALRRIAAELCDAGGARRLAPGRAALTLHLEDAPSLRVEQAARERTAEEEPRITGIGLAFDHLTAPAAKQLPAFEARVGRWEELRWSLERLTMRFGEGRLWRAVHDRPTAALAEEQTRLVRIGQP